ncbi:MAG: FAD:protein FMN transferase [Lewinella sp.]|nr:FAD:protein FMN transferase [Lewinella sp.]
MRPMLIFGFALLSSGVIAQEASVAHKVLRLMGTRFELTAVADNDAQAWAAVETGIAEIRRIEALISSWDEHSQTSEINRQAGLAPVEVDAELYELIFRALKVSGLTGGAFDISFASMERIWQFDGQEQTLPDPAIVAEARQLIDWHKIRLDAEAHTVFLTEPGMRIGFGAIGKGYAANRAKAIMREMPGVRGGLVNASGDLISWGESDRDEGWTIKIADPRQQGRALAWLHVGDMAVVTSGDYERYFTSNGQRYAHIIDPRTGYPTTGVKSVTIICPDAELADALATSVFALGAEEGLHLLNQLNGIEGLIVSDTDEILTSDHLQINYY